MTTSASNFRLIDARSTVTPVIGSWDTFYIKHLASDETFFNSWDFLAVLDEDGTKTDWLVSVAAATSHMVIFETTAWYIVKMLGLPVPDAAIMILSSAQLKTAVPHLKWGKDHRWPCFARREYDYAPARVSFTDALALLATEENRAEALIKAAPGIWHYASSLLKPDVAEVFMGMLARVAGVDPELVKKPAKPTAPEPKKATRLRRQQTASSVPATL